MKASLDASLGVLDRILAVVNTKKRAYVLILLWVLGAASYGAFKLFSIDTIEYFIMLNKCEQHQHHDRSIGKKTEKVSHLSHKLQPPIVH